MRPHRSEHPCRMLDLGEQVGRPAASAGETTPTTGSYGDRAVRHHLVLPLGSQRTPRHLPMARECRKMSTQPPTARARTEHLVRTRRFRSTNARCAESVVRHPGARRCVSERARLVTRTHAHRRRARLLAVKLFAVGSSPSPGADARRPGTARAYQPAAWQLTQRSCRHVSPRESARTKRPSAVCRRPAWLREPSGSLATPWEQEVRAMHDTTGRWKTAILFARAGYRCGGNGGGVASNPPQPNPIDPIVRLTRTTC
jgi:hypothetical protein